MIKNDIRKRDVAIDCLKGFAIFLVLWGHCIQYLSSTHYSEQPVYRIIYSFHMPLFMALVGYFASSLLNLNSFFKVFWKKFKQLIIPAITFIFLLHIAGLNPSRGIIPGLKYMVINLWFLKSAFICILLFYISAKKPKYRKAGIVISLILSQFIILWYYQINIMYPCFIFGYLMYEKRKMIEEYSGRLLTISGVIFLTMLLFFDAKFWEIPSVTVDLTDSAFGEYWFKHFYKIIIGISGTLFFFTLFIVTVAQIIPDRIKAPIQSLGQKTLGIYLIQSLVVEVILARTLKFDDLDPVLFNAVVTPVIAILSLLLCVIVVKLLERTRLTSFLLLGKQSCPSQSHTIPGNPHQ